MIRRWVRRLRRLHWQVRPRTRLLLLYGGGLLATLLVMAQLAFGILPGSWGTGALVRQPTPVVVLPTPTSATLSKDGAISLVYAFDLSMQDFVLTLDPATMQPFVNPDGPLWTELQQMANERTQSGEIHYVALTRFGVAEVIPGTDEIQVRAAEVWNDQAVDRNTGQVNYAVEGIAQEVLYRLRPVEGTGEWLIWSQETIRTVGVPDVTP